MHDFRHPGVSNSFLTRTCDPLALRYNDESVLENFHVAEAFALMIRGGAGGRFDVLGGLAPEQRLAARFVMIKLVLATDLAQGAKFTNMFKSKMGLPNMGESDEDRLLTMQMMVKCADVSHPARELSVHEEWSARISEEFYLQGDTERELGLPISPLCDRAAHNLAKSQIGFIEFVVRPAFVALTVFCEVETWMDGLRANLRHWKELAAADAPAAAQPAATPSSASAASASSSSAAAASAAAASAAAASAAAAAAAASVAVDVKVAQPMLRSTPSKGSRLSLVPEEAERAAPAHAGLPPRSGPCCPPAWRRAVRCAQTRPSRPAPLWRAR